MSGAVDLATLRGALWALRARRAARHDLRHRPVADVRLPSPPALPPGAVRGVRSALRRRRATCLERALVLQQWHVAQGRPREVVIGVVRRGEGVVAHAWLDGDAEAGLEEFQELTRIGPSR